MYVSLTLILIKYQLPFILLISGIFEHICIRYLYFYSNPPLHTVQLLVFEVLISHEIKELLPPGDYHDLYPGNYEPTAGIKFSLVRISISKQHKWLDVVNEDLK